MMKRLKKRYLILSAILLALILGATIGSTLSYFTTYTRAVGGKKVTLGYSTTNTETFSNGVKHLTITNDEDSQPVFVRAKAFSALEFTCEGTGWSTTIPAGSKSDGQEGYYYYELPLDAGQSAEELLVSFTLPDKDDVMEGDSFSVVVIYESTPVKYDEDGNAYADWTTVLQVKQSTGGEG